MRDAGASFKVAKNRLARIALDGTPYTGIGDLLTGPTAIAASTDPVAAAKVAVEFAKTNDKLEIVGGGMGDRKSTRLNSVTNAQLVCHLLRAQTKNKKQTLLHSAHRKL